MYIPKGDIIETDDVEIKIRTQKERALDRQFEKYGHVGLVNEFQTGNLKVDRNGNRKKKKQNKNKKKRKTQNNKYSKISLKKSSKYARKELSKHLENEEMCVIMRVKQVNQSLTFQCEKILTIVFLIVAVIWILVGITVSIVHFVNK